MRAAMIASLLLSALLLLRPLPTCAAEPRIIQLSGSGANMLALREDGTVVGWGEFNEGQLGPNPQRHGSSREARPTLIPLPARVREIAGGGTNGYALTEDGRVLAWGAQVGLGGGRPVPSAGVTVVQVPLPPVRHLYARESTAIALLEDGSLRAWGQRGGGKIGDGLANKRWGEASPPALTPVRVPGATDITQVAMGASHTLALRRDGTVLSWGVNRYGELGRQPVQEPPLDLPAPVEGLSDVTTVAAGANVSMAVRRDGTLLAWGSRRCYMLGDGLQDDPPERFSARPLPVAGVRAPKAVQLSVCNAIALFEDGSAMGWGNTDWGTLGLGQKTGYVKQPKRLTVRDIALVYSLGHRVYLIKRDGSSWYAGHGGKDEWQSPVLTQATFTPIPLAP